MSSHTPDTDQISKPLSDKLRRLLAAHDREVAACDHLKPSLIVAPMQTA